MGRFSALVAEHSAASASTAAPEDEEEEFFVDNSQLKSSFKGLRFRRSPSMKEGKEDGNTSQPKRFAPFGSFIHGVPYNDRWIKVKNHFLPRKVGGTLVLIPAKWVRQEDILDEDSSATVRKAPRDHLGVELVPGTGELFEVVHASVFIRLEPLVDSPPVGCRKAGDVVELFELDSARIFRRVKATLGGWMMIDHPHFGPLLRPKDQPPCSTPLVPICEAAAEGNLSLLRSFISEKLDINTPDADGCTPLMLAAMKAHLDCCVVLLDAGADPTIVAPNGLNAASLASNSMVRALIVALSGQDFDIHDYDAAAELLQPEIGLIADKLFDEAAAELESRRNREEQVNDFDAATKLLQPEIGLIADRVVAPQDDPCVPLVPGTGALYEVVHASVFIRLKPLVDSPPVGCRKAGAVVELFEWDSARIFRRVNATLGGWMMIDHPHFGPLLRPKDQPRCNRGEQEH